MAEASIPVDLFNPGQVLACLGLVEAADRLLGRAEGAFDWSRPDEDRFLLRAAGDEGPVDAVLRFLDDADVVAEAPHGSRNLGSWIAAWGKVTELDGDAPYPTPDAGSPATLVARLRAGDRELTIDHWADTERDPFKLWAGARGYPGACRARDALTIVRGRGVAAAGDPFALSAAQSSSFGLDWRRDYIPIDAGFSINCHHRTIRTVGFPLVELLGALGLGDARPSRVSKLEYVYGVIGRDGSALDLYLPPRVLRAALGAIELPFPMRRFRMSLGWPAQEDQGPRAITNVTEESMT